MKRQIIAPFDLAFFYARYLQYKHEGGKIIHFEKSEIKSERLIVKISYNDSRLIYDIGTKFIKGYSKFNDFYYKWENKKAFKANAF
jgi:hypothetical protein